MRILTIGAALVGLVMATAAFGPAPKHKVHESRQIFVAVLSGGYEVPPVTSAATGTAEFTLTGSELVYDVRVSGLNDVTAAHIHLGAPGTDGAAVATLFTGPASGVTGELAHGTIKPSDVHGTTFAKLVEALRKGDAYVNIHSAASPSGVIRGQIRQQPA